MNPPPRTFHHVERVGLQDMVIAAYDGVKTTSQIARQIGTTTGYVSKAIFRLKLKEAAPVRKADLMRRMEYAACAAAGMTAYECAEKLGVSYHTVRSMARDHGWTFKSSRRPRAPKAPTQPKPQKQKPVAVKVSASPDAIRRYLERAK